MLEGVADTGYVWVHLRRDAPGNAQWLKAQSGLPVVITDGLSADDTRPRVTLHEPGALVNLRAVNLTPGAEPEDMISVRLWVDADRVVGVWLRPMRVIAGLHEALARGRGPNSPGDFVARLATRIVEGIEPVVAALNDAVDDLEEAGENLQRGALSEQRSRLADLRRRAIALRRFMAPQRDALSALASEELPWLTRTARSGLREASDRTTRLAEELEAVRERVGAAQDQLLDRRSEEMNRTMMLLAVVTALFLPLGLLTGLLGINVGGMPGVESPNAFWLVCGMLLGLGLALFAAFRWRGWL
ncbi:MAG: CorA family divalent cation transporter [Pseudomonadota bacterium]